MITWGVQLASLGYEIPDLKLKIPGRIAKKILNLNCFGGFGGGIPLQSPPFGVTSAEVAIICPEYIVYYMKSYYMPLNSIRNFDKWKIILIDNHQFQLASFILMCLVRF